jgi:hypothetical protein
MWSCRKLTGGPPLPVDMTTGTVLNGTLPPNHGQI